MKKLFFSTIIISSCSLTALSAHAGMKVGDAEISGNVGFASEYAFRGISQSDEGLALQGGVDVTHESGLYIGVWGSNVDFNDGDEASVETDIYAGYSGSLESFNYDIGAIYYAYPGADSDLDYDFVELSLSLGYDFDVAAVSAAVNYSPDYFASSGDSFYYSGALDIPLPHSFSLSGHVGYQQIDDNAAFGVDDYMDWSVGIGYNWKNIDVSLSYIDTDLDEPAECANGCEDRIILGVTYSF